MHINGIKLTKKDFSFDNKNVYINKNITKGNPGLLLIYADWCGYCNRFKPVYNEICDQMGSKFPCVSIEHSDLTNDEVLISKLDFQGYPTIKFFDQHGKILGDYNGDRNKSSILKHICDMYHHCVRYH